MSTSTYDLAVVGGGPAGVAAAVAGGRSAASVSFSTTWLSTSTDPMPQA